MADLRNRCTSLNGKAKVDLRNRCMSLISDDTRKILGHDKTSSLRFSFTSTSFYTSREMHIPLRSERCTSL